MLPVWLAQAIETEEERSKMEQLYDEYERLLYSIAFRYSMIATGHKMRSMIHL